MLLLFMGTGCKEDEQKCNTNAVTGSQDDIVGEWKQVKGKTVFSNPQIIEYTCNNIIYKFKSDGSLNILSDVENPIGYNSGDHIYEFSQNNLYGIPDENFTLKIDNTNWACSISGSNMVLDDSPLDGPILYFIRIK
jgi:hypothetical protein